MISMKVNSVSGSVEFKTRRDAEKFYWWLPNASQGFCMGTKVLVSHERNRRTMQRIVKRLEKLEHRIVEKNIDCYRVIRG